MDILSYEDFRAQYEAMYPASKPSNDVDIEEYPPWLQPLSLFMYVAASIVSGAHTVSTVRYTLIESFIPEAVKDPAAYSAFFAFELALFVAVFATLRSYARWIPFTAVGVVFTVIVAANVRDVMLSVESGNVLTAIIIGGIGIGTPLVALMSGKLFVDIYRSHRSAARRAREQYHADLEAWDKRIKSAWTRYQNDQEKAAGVSNPVSKKPSKIPASDRVRNYIKNNDDWQELSLRELGRRANASKSTVSNVLAEFSANGHIEPSS